MFDTIRLYLSDRRALKEAYHLGSEAFVDYSHDASGETNILAKQRRNPYKPSTQVKLYLEWRRSWEDSTQGYRAFIEDQL